MLGAVSQLGRRAVLGGLLFPLVDWMGVLVMALVRDAHGPELYDVGGRVDVGDRCDLSDQQQSQINIGIE